MKDQNFTSSFTVDKPADAVFAAINNVRGWWSQDISGPTDRVGEAFDYRYRDMHRCTIKVVELVPASKVAWHVVKNHFNFTKDETEWTGTDIVFDIAQRGGKTEVRFTHVGLVPDYECFDICSDGWSTYINGSLRSLIVSGKGQPNVGEPMNESERSLAS